jgi:nitroreductase
MDVFEALYTTRAMRRLKAEPVPDDVIARIIDAGIRAPSGGNAQAWRFMAVTDPDVIGRLAPLYKNGLAELYKTVYADATAAAASAPANDRRAASVARVQSSAQWLADHFAEVPLLIIGFAVGGQAAAGSMYPALWSMCLAARAFGIGSTLTTLLNMAPAETNEILGVPSDAGYEMVACLPMGYPTGKWGIAERKPAEKVTYVNRWGERPSWTAPEVAFGASLQ